MFAQENLYLWLQSDNGLYVHVGLFVLLILGGLGFPIPEDIPLLLAGVVASKGIVSLEAVFITCYVGVMLGDQIMYLFGHLFGKRLLAAGTRSPFFPMLTQEKVAAVRDGLRRRKLLYIFLARHLFPIRSATFIVAGAVHIPFFEFLLADAAAAFVSATIMIGLGYLLGGRITPETIEHIGDQAHLYIMGLIAIGSLFYMVRRKCKRKAERLPEKLSEQIR